MNIVIVGAGLAGLAAAYDLAKAGHTVAVYEASAQAGGLASGFRDARWEWPLERFYHHIFTTDAAIIDLVREIGFTSQMFFRRPLTAQWWGQRGYALTGARPALRLPGTSQPRELPVPDLAAGALAVLTYPGLPPLERLRLNALMAYLKLGVRDWRPLERVTAASWTRRWGGETLYQGFFGPLLEGKFGPYAEQVNMAWLWSRFKARSVRLGYFQGGFQGLADALVAAVRRLGVSVTLGTAVEGLALRPAGGWRVALAASSTLDADAVIVTGAPGLLRKLAPELPGSYLIRLDNLRSMGAVVMTIALKESLTGGLYWVNMPKDQFPFLALVEHTNFIDRAHYGGDTLVYCGDYLDPAHEYFQLSDAALLERFLPALQRVNPRFERGWVRDFWVHRERYAQPVVPVNHARNIPPLATPLPGLFWASMSQVYPWDRGTNFAVELGRDVARAAVAYSAVQR